MVVPTKYDKVMQILGEEDMLVESLCISITLSKSGHLQFSVFAEERLNVRCTAQARHEDMIGGCVAGPPPSDRRCHASQVQYRELTDKGYFCGLSEQGTYNVHTSQGEGFLRSRQKVQFS